MCKGVAEPEFGVTSSTEGSAPAIELEADVTPSVEGALFDSNDSAAANPEPEQQQNGESVCAASAATDCEVSIADSVLSQSQVIDLEADHESQSEWNQSPRDVGSPTRRPRGSREERR